MEISKVLLKESLATYQKQTFFLCYCLCLHSSFDNVPLNGCNSSQLVRKNFPSGLFGSFRKAATYFWNRFAKNKRNFSCYYEIFNIVINGNRNTLLQQKRIYIFSHYPSKHGYGNIVTKILKFTVQKLFAIELDIRQILEIEFRILTMSTATLQLYQRRQRNDKNTLFIIQPCSL